MMLTTHKTHILEKKEKEKEKKKTRTHTKH